MNQNRKLFPISKVNFNPPEFISRKTVRICATSDMPLKRKLRHLPTAYYAGSIDHPDLSEASPKLATHQPKPSEVNIQFSRHKPRVTVSCKSSCSELSVHPQNSQMSKLSVVTNAMPEPKRVSNAIY